MKVALLCGGLGTRLSEETVLKPKPMVEIGGHPILWHIMNIYAHHGFKDFVLACGYKAEIIKDYFCNYALLDGDIMVDLRRGKIAAKNTRAPDWNVAMVDTGLNTQTGGRVKRLADWVDGKTFMLTYGDGVGNIDIKKLVEFHQSRGALMTITAVRPPSRFGAIDFEGDKINRFAEKSQVGEGWINGGYMVVEPKVFDYIDNDEDIFERGPMERLAREGQLVGYRHDGFWQPMDTLREKQLLETLWQSGKAPWKMW